MEKFNPQRYLRSIGFEQKDWGCDRIMRHKTYGKKPDMFGVLHGGVSVQFSYSDNIERKEYDFFVFQDSRLCTPDFGGYLKTPDFDPTTKEGWIEAFKQLKWEIC